LCYLFFNLFIIKALHIKPGISLQILNLQHMKKTILIVFAVMMVSLLSAQTIVFQEGFENSTLGFTSSATDTSGVAITNFKPWNISTNLFHSGLKSDTNTLQPGKMIYLTSNSFSTIGYPIVTLEFSQICKLYFLDGGKIDVSIDNGISWTNLGPMQYQGTATLISHLGIYYFSESAYNDWIYGDTVTKPTNLWWKNEKFDLSSLAGNKANVKIRFAYYSTGISAGSGRYGWLLDDIKVTLNTVMGIEDNNKNSFLTSQIFPNPSNGICSLEYSIPLAAEVKIDIINLFGQKVFSSIQNEIAGKHKISLDLSKFADGTYCYIIEYNGIRQLRKIVINKLF
jgi:hypothetical protein